MIFAVGISAFFAGFSVATLLMVKSQVRPEVKQVMVKMGVTKTYKAKVPKPSSEEMDENEMELEDFARI